MRNFVRNAHTKTEKQNAGILRRIHFQIYFYSFRFSVFSPCQKSLLKPTVSLVHAKFFDFFAVLQFCAVLFTSRVDMLPLEKKKPKFSWRPTDIIWMVHPAVMKKCMIKKSSLKIQTEQQRAAKKLHKTSRPGHPWKTLQQNSKK